MKIINKKIEEIDSYTQDNEKYNLILLEIAKLFNEKIIGLGEKMTDCSNKSELVKFLKSIETYKKSFFIFCCNIHNIDRFNLAFSYYRDFLQNYNKQMQLFDDICIKSFDETIVECTEQIQKYKKELRDINNDNVSQHTKLHKYNEPLYLKIEELEKERLNLLCQD